MHFPSRSVALHACALFVILAQPTASHPTYQSSEYGMSQPEDAEPTEDSYGSEEPGAASHKDQRYSAYDSEAEGYAPEHGVASPPRTEHAGVTNTTPECTSSTYYTTPSATPNMSPDEPGNPLPYSKVEGYKGESDGVTGDTSYTPANSTYTPGDDSVQDHSVQPPAESYVAPEGEKEAGVPSETIVVPAAEITDQSIHEIPYDVSGEDESDAYVEPEQDTGSYVPAKNPADGYMPAETTVPAQPDSNSYVEPEQDTSSYVPAENPTDGYMPVETTVPTHPASNSYVESEQDTSSYVPAENPTDGYIPAETAIPAQPDSNSYVEPEQDTGSYVPAENPADGYIPAETSVPSQTEWNTYVASEQETGSYVPAETAYSTSENPGLEYITPDNSLPDVVVKPETPCGSCLLPTDILPISNRWLSSFSTGGLWEMPYAATEDVQYWNEEFTYPGCPTPYANNRTQLESIIDDSAKSWTACSNITFEVVSAWNSCDRIALRWRQLGYATGRNEHATTEAGTQVTFSGIDLLTIDLSSKMVRVAETSADRINYYNGLGMNPFATKKPATDT